MRIAIIGADGQLGSDLVKVLETDEIHPLYHPAFDVTRADKAREVLSSIGPEIVINTAAYHRVDECEDNPGQAFLVNALAVRDLAFICKDIDAVLAHFSTDYVFDGRKGTPYVEEDCPHPLNAYGVSKLAGEIFLRTIWEKHFLIRTCGLYGEAGSREKGTNFVEAVIMRERQGKPLRVVNDQWVTPTSTAELAVRLSELIRTGHYGLFHMTNEGECTWHEFCMAVFSLLGKTPTVEPADSSTYGAKALRPLYSVLENRRAGKVGLTGFSHWKDALRDYLRRKGHLS